MDDYNNTVKRYNLTVARGKRAKIQILWWNRQNLVLGSGGRCTYYDHSDLQMTTFDLKTMGAKVAVYCTAVGGLWSLTITMLCMPNVYESMLGSLFQY